MCVLVSGALTISMSHADALMAPLLATQHAQQQHDADTNMRHEHDTKHVSVSEIKPEWIKSV